MSELSRQTRQAISEMIDDALSRHVAECHAKDDDVVDGHICGGEWRPFTQGKCGLCDDGPVQSPPAAPVQAKGMSETVATPPHDGSYWHTRVQANGASKPTIEDALTERITYLEDARNRLTRERDEARAELEKARGIDVEALEQALTALWLAGEWNVEPSKTWWADRAKWLATRYRAELAKKEGR